MSNESQVNYLCTVEGRTSSKSYRIKQLQDIPSHVAKKADDTYPESDEKRASEVDEFHSKFIMAYPDLKHRVSLLQPLNEYNIKHFACAFIQPTVLPYSELYDFRQCVEYVARHIDYEPLENAVTEYTVVSPARTLSWAVGDACDITFLVASLLIGAGYDAYVLLGKAPSWICLKDQSHMNFTLIKNNGNNLGCESGSVDIVLRDECYTRKQCNSSGIHCWLLLKEGKRKLEDGPYFVETSTGILYRVCKDAPYDEIWFACNETNSWVNIGTASIKDFNPDFPIDDWVQVLSKRDSSYTSDKKSDAASHWSSKINIPMERFLLRYPPNGKKCLILDRAKIEYFGEMVDPQGLVCRVTTYMDQSQIAVAEYTEIFSPNRRNDHMIQRTRKPMYSVYEEHFSFKNIYCLSEWKEVAGSQYIAKFFAKTRADGLVERVYDIGTMITETFQGRADSLLRRCVYLSEIQNSEKKSNNLEIISIGTGRVAVISKIYEYFEESVKKDASEQCVSSRCYQLNENKIIVTYQCKHEILQQSDVYDKDELKKSNSPFLRLLQLEIVSINQVKKTHEEMIELNDLLKIRETNDSRALTSLNRDQKECTSHGIDGAINPQVKANEMDYITPFLINTTESTCIPKDEALLIRETCLHDMKERLMRRASIMKNRLENEKERLCLLQESYQKQKLGPLLEGQQSLEKTITDDMHRLEVMEKRLSQHEEKSILKYRALVKMLSMDDRLASLYKEED